MSGPNVHTTIEDVTGRILLSRFVFQTGVGAVTVSLVWCYLTSVDWEPGRADLFPLILFGLALPWLVFPIPARIISSATASGRFLMSVSILLALLTVAVSFGRLIFSWDRAFIVLLAGAFTSVAVVAQTLWDRLWPLSVRTGEPCSRPGDGVLSYGGWIAGMVAASVISLPTNPNLGLWFGAVALAVGGWLLRPVPRKVSSANWLSNRSALRLFSAIENAYRSRESRLVLLRVFWFSGASLSLIAMVSGGWNSTTGGTVLGGVTPQVDYLELVVILVALVAGLAMGRHPMAIHVGQSRPGLTLAAICVAIPAAGLGITLLPSPFPALLALVLGAGCGVVMGAASRHLKMSLGAIFAAESEILLWTVVGAGGTIFCASFWIAHVIAGFGQLLLGAEVLFFVGFAVTWRRHWSCAAGEKKVDVAFDPWYPGKLQNFARETGEASLFSIAYEIPEEQRDAFLEAVRDLAHLREKQGALFWTLAESAENREILKEQFIIESLSAYREAVRSETREEREIKQRVFNLNRWDSLPCESRHRLLEA